MEERQIIMTELNCHRIFSVMFLSFATTVACTVNVTRFSKYIFLTYSGLHRIDQQLYSAVNKAWYDVTVTSVEV